MEAPTDTTVAVYCRQVVGPVRKPMTPMTPTKRAKMMTKQAGAAASKGAREIATRLRHSHAVQSLGTRIKTNTPKKLTRMMARCRDMVNERVAEMRGQQDGERDAEANHSDFELVGEVTIPYTVKWESIRHAAQPTSAHIILTFFAYPHTHTHTCTHTYIPSLAVILLRGCSLVELYVSCALLKTTVLTWEATSSRQSSPTVSAGVACASVGHQGVVAGWRPCIV